MSMWLILYIVSIVDSKKIRKAKGITQDNLGSIDGISRSTIGMGETAKTDITLSKIKIIADALNIPPKDLLDF